jgi:hypothetical protein
MKANYPGTQLGKHLNIVSQIIKSGAATRVYYVSQGGYDTHVAQLPRLESLLGELSSAIQGVYGRSWRIRFIPARVVDDLLASSSTKKRSGNERMGSR